MKKIYQKPTTELLAYMEEQRLLAGSNGRYSIEDENGNQQGEHGDIVDVGDDGPPSTAKGFDGFDNLWDDEW